MSATSAAPPIATTLTLATALPAAKATKPTRCDPFFAKVATFLQQDREGGSVAKFYTRARVKETEAGEEKLFEAISSLSQTLLGAKFERARLHNDAAIAIATFSLVVLQGQNFSIDDASVNETHYFQKEVTFLPRDIQYDSASQTVAVVAEQHLSHLNRDSSLDGSYKAIRSATLIALNHPTCAAQKVVFSYTEEEETGSLAFNEIHQELLLFSYLNPTRGLVNLYNSATVIEENGKSYITSVFEAFEENLYFITSNPKEYSLKHKLEITRDLIEGLCGMHQQGVIHGDIKLKNALFEILSDNTARGAWCDLGFAFMPLIDSELGAKHRGQKQPKVMNWGYYGSIWGTPPEIFGKENYVPENKESYFKMDVFALGCILHEFLLKGNPIPPWNDIVAKSYKENFDIDASRHRDYSRLVRDRIALQKSINTTIEEPVKKLLANYSTLTYTHKLVCVIYQMLRLYPKDRISLTDALNQMHQIIFEHNAQPAKPKIPAHTSTPTVRQMMNRPTNQPGTKSLPDSKVREDGGKTKALPPPSAAQLHTALAKLTIGTQNGDAPPKK